MVDRKLILHKNFGLSVVAEANEKSPLLSDDLVCEQRHLSDSTGA